MSETNYAIMRFAKLKRSDLAKTERHHSKRESLHTRSHPERENENIVRRLNNQSLLKNVSAIIKNQENTTNRKVRKDANVCIEWVLTYSPERKLDDDMEEFKRWAKTSINFAVNASGKNAKLLQFCIEFDETTPHVHVFVCPIDSKGNINFKEAVQSKKDIERMQDDYAELMKPFGLSRGKKKSVTKAKNKPLKQYYKELDEKLEKEYIEKQIDLNKKIQESELKYEKQKQKEIDGLFNDTQSKKSSNQHMHEADDLWL